jgi:2-aminoadipate transaminase
LLDSGGGLNPFTSAIIREVIEAGDLEKNVNRLIGIYRPRVTYMDSLLREHLPEVTYSVPHGGYFFWVRLPEGVDAYDLRQKAQAYKVDIRQGALFSSQNGLKSHMRLCFAFHAENEMKDGIVRLKESLENSL